MSAATSSRTRPLTGDTKMSFVLDDHMGWLKCDGRAMDPVAYNLLFQVIGYTFGQSGNQFLLPNAQGRVMGAAGQVTDAQPTPQTVTYAPGTKLGEIQHTLVQTEMPSHNHDTAGAQSNPPVTAAGNTSTIGSHAHTYNDAYFAEANGDHIGSHNVFGSGSTADSDNGFYFRCTDGTATIDPTIATAQLPTSQSGAHNHTIHSNGGDAAHNNMQPTLFYGNHFIYSGIPTMGMYPFTTGRNPVLI